MSSSSTRSRSSAGKAAQNAKESSREFQMVEIIFGSARASQISGSERSRLDQRVQQLTCSLSRDQREVIQCRYNLDGERNAPISSHRDIAAELKRGPDQVARFLSVAERTLREGLERSFPQLKAPARTPQNS